jgi:hypothetical protein
MMPNRFMVALTVKIRIMGSKSRFSTRMPIRTIISDELSAYS